MVVMVAVVVVVVVEVVVMVVVVLVVVVVVCGGVWWLWCRRVTDMCVSVHTHADVQRIKRGPLIAHWVPRLD